VKIAQIATDWNVNDYRRENNEYGGVSYYRLLQPKRVIDGHQIDYFAGDLNPDDKRQEKFWLDFVDQYDLIITKQIDTPQAGAALFWACDTQDVPVVMDLDDNFLAVDESNPAYDKGYQKAGKKRAFASSALSLADGFFVSTQPLQDAYRDILSEVYDQQKPSFVLPNCNNADDFDYGSPKDDDAVVVGWHGSVTHDADLKLVLPTIRKIMQRNENVELSLMGGVREETITDLFEEWSLEMIENRIRFHGGTPSWNGFPAALMKKPWDIGIAPLVDNEFNRGKSHIKWMEQAMKKIPTVASAVYPYEKPVQGTDVIRDGKTGFLVEDDEWDKALTYLIENEDVRNEVGQAAYKQVVDEWQYETHAFKWEQAIEGVVKYT